LPILYLDFANKNLLIFFFLVVFSAEEDIIFEMKGTHNTPGKSVIKVCTHDLC